MTLTSEPPDTTAKQPTARRGHWIDDWRPEDPTFWEETGRAVARRNLVWSIFAEHLGFSVWLMWSVSSAFLLAQGFAFTPQQLFLLVALPNLVGSLLRLPYTFAVPRFGGRNWTMVSAGAAAHPDAAVRARGDEQPARRTGSSASIAATGRLRRRQLRLARWPTSTSSTRPPRRARRSGSTPPAATSGVSLIQFLLPVIVVVWGPLRRCEGQRGRDPPRAGLRSYTPPSR